jgi:hypothetical protein
MTFHRRGGAVRAGWTTNEWRAFYADMEAFTMCVAHSSSPCRHYSTLIDTCCNIAHTPPLPITRRYA